LNLGAERWQIGFLGPILGVGCSFLEATRIIFFPIAYRKDLNRQSIIGEVSLDPKETETEDIEDPPFAP
jgi:hypothetical protein